MSVCSERDRMGFFSLPESCTFLNFTQQFEAFGLLRDNDHLEGSGNSVTYA